MTENTENIVVLLEKWRDGDIAAREILFAAIHAELSQIAAFLLRREADNISISTGDLVNEATLRLLRSGETTPTDKAHFLALSARVMRHVLIDTARKREAEKRRKITVTLTGNEHVVDVKPFEFQHLETALIRLKAIDPDRAEIVIMRYYGGMTFEEIAQATDVSESTVKRSWRATRAWLRGAMTDDHGQD